jgi:hypothetical protein
MQILKKFGACWRVCFLFVTLCASSAFAQTTPPTTNAATTLYLTRTAEQVASTNKAGKIFHAKRGVLQVGNLSFPTIERIGTVRLKPGVFECAMEQQHNADGSNFQKVFRVKAQGPGGHNLKGGTGPARILIHAANYAYELTGCVAPGMITSEQGIDHSNEALNKIFKECGGFVDGKKVTLVVRNQ